MPNHGKGGRKPEGAQAKSAQIPVRTSPELRDALLVSADAEGRSLTREIELRLQASLSLDWRNLDEPTQALLAAVRRDVSRAEQITGKKWHKDYRTWAMVREAMTTDVIEARSPTADALEGFEGKLSELSAELRGNIDKQQALVFSAGEWGHTVVLNKRGLVDFGAAVFDTDGAREELERQSNPKHPEATRDIFDKIDALEGQRRPIAEKFIVIREAAASAINEAVATWREDAKARDAHVAADYRPDFGMKPLHIPKERGGKPAPTGYFVTSEIDPNFQRIIDDERARLSGTKLDDNPA